MASAEWMEARVNSIMRQLRMEDKARENQGKPILNSPDVLQTRDYIFSPITPLDRVGDSGQLLLAKKKSDRSHRYLVKHEFTDCAANEFVYTKLAQAMGLKMPDAVLFQLSDGEKRRYFKTEYILGTRFLDLVIESPTYQQIREQAINWQDYYRFRAMYTMFREADSFEVPLASDGYIYRVDTTASFILPEGMLAQAGVNEVIGGIVPKEEIRKYTEQFNYDNCWQYGGFDSDLSFWIEKHGEECRKFYLEPLARIQEIPHAYIDDTLNTLCYFYPDFIGDYFKRFISALQKQAAIFLKENR